jgi:hypothetical protein
MYVLMCTKLFIYIYMMRCSNHYLSICNCIYIKYIYTYKYTHDDLGNALDSIHYLQRKVPSPAALSPGSMIDSWADHRKTPTKRLRRKVDF